MRLPECCDNLKTRTAREISPVEKRSTRLQLHLQIFVVTAERDVNIVLNSATYGEDTKARITTRLSLESPAVYS